MKSQIANRKSQIKKRAQAWSVKRKGKKIENRDFLPGIWKLGFDTSRGFTLVEMLTVVTLFVIIGTITMSILLTTFRTSTKTDTVTAMQNNGNYALTQMAKTLRNARGLVSPFPCKGSITTGTVTVLTPANNKITYTCNYGSPANIASDGALLLDTNIVMLKSCSFVCSQDSSSNLPAILINFSLQQQSTSSFVERIASTSAVPFQTSVVLRNINR